MLLRLFSCEFEQLLDGGCNGVGGVKVWLRRLLHQLERLLQVLFCGVVVLLQRRRMQLLRWGGRGRVKAGFLGIDRLCALRDVARVGGCRQLLRDTRTKAKPEDHAQSTIFKQAYPVTLG